MRRILQILRVEEGKWCDWCGEMAACKKWMVGAQEAGGLWMMLCSECSREWDLPFKKNTKVDQESDDERVAVIAQK